VTHIAVPWWRYAERIGYQTCAYAGINAPGAPNYACSNIWTGAQRAMLAFALAEAQDEIEQEVGFFLAPDWVAGERQPWARRMFTQWGYVIEPGVLSDTKVGDSIVPDYAIDPATLTMAVGTCAPENLHLYHEDTDIEVYATGYTVAGGNIVWTIPWCRLVAPAYEDTDEQGLDYADVATWGAPHLDVRCRVTDASDQATLIWRGSACTPPCADIRKAGCIYIRDERLGIIEVQPATYTSGAWTRLCVCGEPDWALLNYKSGMTPLTKQAEDTIIRLAHSKMPDEPCACAITQSLWKRDRTVPPVLTRERVNNPFGMSDGAWTAWRFAQTMKLVRSRGNL
jgi:hypothetical protein